MSKTKKTKSRRSETSSSSEKAGKMTGIPLPLLPFPEGFEEWKTFCIQKIKELDEELVDVEGHIKENYTKDILIHLYHTNRVLDKILYILLWTIHLHSHSERGFKELAKIRQKVVK